MGRLHDKVALISGGAAASGPVDNGFQHSIEVRLTGEQEARAPSSSTSASRSVAIATADEIARTVPFLASDDSAFMTGATVKVDSGVHV